MRPRPAVVAMILVIAALTVLCALPHADPVRVDLAEVLAGPSWTHPLGTDHLGRDLWALTASGYWRTLTVVAAACSTSLLVGVPLGLLAGFRGGLLDATIRTVTDLTMVIPSFVAALIITSIVSLTPFTAGVVLGCFGAGPYVNQVRALTRTVRSRDYVQVERLLGTPTAMILGRHVLPAVRTPLFRYFGASASGAVLAYAGLAFIGLGIDATTPDWGTMLYAYRSMTDHPILILAPAAGILLLALFFHVVFDREHT
ncbi:MAG: ABC transporter permease [Propionibacteriaceae bacterium]|nr:ABC transporter permease [Propionibacteriaceae bacterium]